MGNFRGAQRAKKDCIERGVVVPVGEYKEGYCACPRYLHRVKNGQLFRAFDVNDRLKRNKPSVIQLVHAMSPEEQFAFGLRANINRKSAHSDEAAAGLTTTFFKDNGISGWESRPLKEATVIGILRHPPSAGSDGYVSLDLEAREVRANGKFFNVTNGLMPRYIRIEYIHGTDTRFTSWSEGVRLRVSGEVEWDTDQYGFLELHPDRKSDIGPVGDTVHLGKER